MNSDCEKRFYETTYGKSFYPRPIDIFVRKAPHIPETDPTVTPGHFANNIQVNGVPIESKTWENPCRPEEYVVFLKRLEQSNPDIFKKFYKHHNVDFNTVERFKRDSNLTTYQVNYSPEEYISRRDGLKWPRTKLDTSKCKYYETTYKTYYNRIDEINEMRSLAQPVTWQHDVQVLKNELRNINKTPQSNYFINYCAIIAPKMKNLLKAGKVWQSPLDRYSLRKI